MNNSFGQRLQTSSYRLLVRTSQVVACSLSLIACGGLSNKDTKYRQYYVQGEQLYIKHCSNCHQKNGSGLGRLYPPLNTSDYMEKNLDEVLCQMKYGKKGPISVNGVAYNMEMRGIASLTELEIAEISTYIYNTWEHNRGIIDLPQVQRSLAKCQPAW